MRKTVTRLADGRELLYYDRRDDVVREAVDRRSPHSSGSGQDRAGPTVGAAVSEVRRDPLLGDAVIVAAHRQGRTHHPPAGECPLCPSRDGRLSEIPDHDYEVVVFENRFPSLSGDTGRCEVVCFTPDHDASFADLSEDQAALVLAAWTDRTSALAELPGVRQVFCFENRGAEVGVTLAHPHGQIYAYPFVTPRTALMQRAVAAHLATTGRNLFDDTVERELADGARVVLTGAHWVAFVPYAAHWPYEVHLYPRRRVPDLRGLSDGARTAFPQTYLELLRRFDRVFGPDAPPTPYVAAWHQAPYDDERRGDFALHLELFTVRRSPGKLKFLAGSESGMSVFTNDVRPEAAAERLREVATTT
ncbi:galactose-1-phosphate uridylyltransferase [Streptomyces sp. NPDC019396]|uniref:galactose-1-phosphate uridylyltransferase n=1 Tax=Streptomyces sp. NPDC019396 TaxID=3154687 RepID=UPI0033E5EB99